MGRIRSTHASGQSDVFHILMAIKSLRLGPCLQLILVAGCAGNANYCYRHLHPKLPQLFLIEQKTHTHTARLISYWMMMKSLENEKNQIWGQKYIRRFLMIYYGLSTPKKMDRNSETQKLPGYSIPYLTSEKSKKITSDEHDFEYKRLQMIMWTQSLDTCPVLSRKPL